MDTMIRQSTARTIARMMTATGATMTTISAVILIGTALEVNPVATAVAGIILLSLIPSLMAMLFGERQEVGGWQEDRIVD